MARNLKVVRSLVSPCLFSYLPPVVTISTLAHLSLSSLALLMPRALALGQTSPAHSLLSAIISRTSGYCTCCSAIGARLRLRAVRPCSMPYLLASNTTLPSPLTRTQNHASHFTCA